MSGSLLDTGGLVAAEYLATIAKTNSFNSVFRRIIAIIDRTSGDLANNKNIESKSESITLTSLFHEYIHHDSHSLLLRLRFPCLSVNVNIMMRRRSQQHQQSFIYLRRMHVDWSSFPFTFCLSS